MAERDVPADAVTRRESPFDKVGADRLADEVAVLVRRGVLDSRSPAADALLDYRTPPSSERADRMAALTDENAKAHQVAAEAFAWMDSTEKELRALRVVAEAAKKVAAKDIHAEIPDDTALLIEWPGVTFKARDYRALRAALGSLERASRAPTPNPTGPVA